MKMAKSVPKPNIIEGNGGIEGEGLG